MVLTATGLLIKLACGDCLPFNQQGFANRLKIIIDAAYQRHAELSLPFSFSGSSGSSSSSSNESNKSYSKLYLLCRLMMFVDESSNHLYGEQLTNLGVLQSIIMEEELKAINSLAVVKAVPVAAKGPKRSSARINGGIGGDARHTPLELELVEEDSSLADSTLTYGSDLLSIVDTLYYVDKIFG